MMMTAEDRLTLSLSLAGAFVLSATDMYFSLTENNWLTTAAAIHAGIRIVMSGLKGIATYAVGYVQINPRNQPKTAEQVLATVKASDLPLQVKEQVAPALATEAAKPNGPASAVPPPPLRAAKSLPLAPDDGVLFLDCLAVSRFAVAESLAAFHQLSEPLQAAWRLYVAEVLRREKEEEK